MKILFVYQFCSLGGCETVLRNRLVGFRALGIEPHVALLRDLGGGAVFDGFPNVTWPCGTERLAQIVEEGRFDVIAAIDTPQVYPVLQRTRFAGTLVTEVHTNRIDNLQYLYDVATTGTKLLITPSRYEVELVLREFPSLRGGPVSIRVVPNPVDTELFRPLDVPTPPRRLVGWVGRLEDEKNWPYFVEIAATLAAARRDVDFLVVGGWTVTDYIKRQFLDAVKQRGLMRRLRWVSSLPYDAMPRFYSLLARSGGCLVPTSVIEPFGMSVIEAMACGCPVAATRVGAFQELIDDGRTGRLFDLADARGAAARVSSLLDEGPLRDGVIAAAGRAIAEKYAPAPVVRQYLEALRAATVPSPVRAEVAP